MNQAKVTHYVSKLNFDIGKTHRNLKGPEGPEGRLKKIQKTLTALLKYERIELYYNRGDEVRGYVDRLISEAIRHGPAHKETMELANFYILEKQLVHKLFKVLVPRYEQYTSSFTALHKIERDYPGLWYRKSVLELKGNPYPGLEKSNPYEKKLIHNILLDEARKEYRLQKYQEVAENLSK